MGARSRSPARGSFPLRRRRGVPTLTKGELRALLYLLYSPKISITRIHSVLSSYGDARSAWKALGVLTPEIEERTVRGIDALTALGARVVTMNDAAFPDVLRHVALPPAVLFTRGKLGLLHDRTRLGVVGSRNFTEYGAECAKMLTRPVARAGVIIVSGLARGIDSIAHEAALDVGGDTIAVLGNGIDVYHPRRNRRLQERIAEDGLLLTEFPPGTPALPYHFPHRNRIIAYLSKNVLVVEAQRDSGSLSTAAHARESFDVLAVPGPIGRPTSVGTNELIRDGAHAVLTPEDVLYELKVRPSRVVERAPAKPLNIDEESLSTWQALSDEPMHLDEIAARSRRPADEVALALLSLELAGRVRALPGGRYVRA